MSEMLQDRDDALGLTARRRETVGEPPGKPVGSSLAAPVEASPEVPPHPYRRRSDRPLRGGIPIRLFAERGPMRPPRSIAQTFGGKATRFLARNLRTKSIVMRNSTPLVTFTFDDVPASAIELGCEVLEREGVRATFFIAGAGCGVMSPNGRLATVDELRRAVARGHELGCHTFTHPEIGGISRTELAGEVDRNAAFLKANVGITPRNFAFPYGDLAFAAKRYLESHFDSCRCNDHGINAAVVDLGAMKSCALENAAINRLQVLDVIRKAAKIDGWLIFSGHAVEPDPGRFGVTPELLAFAVGAVKAEGFTPVTIAEGLKLVRGDRQACGAQEGSTVQAGAAEVLS